MIDLLHMNLTAERPDNYGMYLFSLRGKVPYFARTEHKNYSRSIDRFLQEMSSLQEFQKRLLFGGEIFFGLVFLKTYVLNKRLWEVFKDIAN